VLDKKNNIIKEKGEDKRHRFLHTRVQPTGARVRGEKKSKIISNKAESELQSGQRRIRDKGIASTRQEQWKEKKTIFTVGEGHETHRGSCRKKESNAREKKKAEKAMPFAVENTKKLKKHRAGVLRQHLLKTKK